MRNIERALESAQSSLDEMLRYLPHDDSTPAMDEKLSVVMESVRITLLKLQDSRRKDISAFDRFICEKQEKRNKQLTR